uniref:Uncharacterized protein n=1 Tax=Setaria viridis TaxID=4556 RepID=A0A4U6TEC5_SETVI|nr:hypothetical protein SEVIR_8G116660v2 [Setaria viridis]
MTPAVPPPTSPMRASFPPVPSFPLVTCSSTTRHWPPPQPGCAPTVGLRARSPPVPRLVVGSSWLVGGSLWLVRVLQAQHLQAPTTLAPSPPTMSLRPPHRPLPPRLRAASLLPDPTAIAHTATPPPPPPDTPPLLHHSRPPRPPAVRASSPTLQPAPAPAHSAFGASSVLPRVHARPAACSHLL